MDEDACVHVWSRPLQVMLQQKKIKARRKKRKELFGGQMCFMALLLLVVSGLSNLAENSGYGISSLSSENSEKWESRRLLQDFDIYSNYTDDVLVGPNVKKNCTPPGIHEFPDDIFTNQERMDGAVALHVLCAMYMFYALALVCDDFFVPSLEKISERLHLSEDVAGATFMAAGSSAPELFTSVIGVFITKGDVGVGTIVGSAVFNILCIIGVCGIFAGQVVRLSCWTLIRDSVYYTISVATLIVVSWTLSGFSCSLDAYGPSRAAGEERRVALLWGPWRTALALIFALTLHVFPALSNNKHKNRTQDIKQQRCYSKIH